MDMEKNVLKIDDEFQEIGTRTIDDRKRLTLGEAIKNFKRVKLYMNLRGELLLQPVVEVPASELWLFQNKEAFESVQKGLKDAAEGRISKLDLSKESRPIVDPAIRGRTWLCLCPLEGSLIKFFAFRKFFFRSIPLADPATILIFMKFDHTGCQRPYPVIGAVIII